MPQACLTVTDRLSAHQPKCHLTNNQNEVVKYITDQDIHLQLNGIYNPNVLLTIEENAFSSLKPGRH